MSELRYYSNTEEVNEFLGKMNLPNLRHEEFYIMRFEDYHQFTKDSSTPIPYSHDYFEISLSIGHDATVTVNSQSQNIIEHNLVFISPRQVVRWNNNTDQACGATTSYIVLFKPSFLPFANDVFDIYKRFPYFNHNTQAGYRISKSLRNDFFEIMHSVYQEYQEEKEDYLEFARAQLSIFLLKAKRALQYTEDMSYLKSRANEITYNFENLIKLTPNKRQPIAYYADRLNVSPVYLSECIKKVTNKTAKAIIDEYLILEARSLLKHSKDSIGQIAANLGFYDDSNFTKYFKNKTGLTPRNFQKQYA